MEKTLMVGKIEGKSRRVQQRMKWIDSITDSTDMNLSKCQGRREDRGAQSATVHWVTKSWTQLSNSTTTTSRRYSVAKDIGRDAELWWKSRSKCSFDQLHNSKSETMATATLCAVRNRRYTYRRTRCLLPIFRWLLLLKICSEGHFCAVREHGKYQQLV